MKTLIITRHAKSDWSNLHLKDFDRELNERGLRDAPMMGKRLLDKKISLDLIISSTAKRAAQTAKLIAKEINYSTTVIQWEDTLYNASPAVLQDIVFSIPNEINQVMIICHNPGITNFVNNIIGKITDDMPTCGMVAFSLDIKNWEDFPTAKVKLLFYDFPKNDARF